ncbi:sugar kinase [Ningiella sp. W23]|uniref:sugar kinase n=1 Tax=Ningiella sp. W23 TaxID=3023715 RepID=UPI003756DD5E
MKLAAIGECMLELSGKVSGNATNTAPMSMSFGGDTLNTLVYAARLGIDSYFFSALGTDAYSDWLLARWKDEGVNTQFVHRIANKLPGMYAIELDERGERSFYYWRKDSAASAYVSELGEQRLFSQLLQMDVIYLSGISLGILDKPQRETLLQIIAKLKAAGKCIAFDGNYRPRNWSSKEEAQTYISKMLNLSDWYLPTLDDEQLLFDCDTKDDVCRLHAHHKISTLVVKDGENGCYIYEQSSSQRADPIHVPIPNKVTPVDTTAAGDSFNAGFIAALMQQQSAQEAALSGHIVAARVIQHRGAIIPR